MQPVPRACQAARSDTTLPLRLPIFEHRDDALYPYNIESYSCGDLPGAQPFAPQPGDGLLQTDFAVDITLHAHSSRKLNRRSRYSGPSVSWYSSSRESKTFPGSKGYGLRSRNSRLDSTSCSRSPAFPATEARASNAHLRRHHWSVFSMVKGKFGDYVRSKSDLRQAN